MVDDDVGAGVDELVLEVEHVSVALELRLAVPLLVPLFDRVLDALAVCELVRLGVLVLVEVVLPVSETVPEDVGVPLCVAVTLDVGVPVLVTLGVKVTLAVSLGVALSELVAELDAVAVGVSVGVAVSDAVNEAVALLEGVSELVGL